MKFNNVESLSVALESAVAELAETKRKLFIANDELGNAKQELTKLQTDLARTDESLEFSEGRRVMVELRADNWQERAEKAEEKLARLNEARERNFDHLLWELAYSEWEMADRKNFGDKEGAAMSKGECNVLGDVIAMMYTRSAVVYPVLKDSTRMLIEVFDGMGEPIAFYHWSANSVMGKFERKLMVNQQ